MMNMRMGMGRRAPAAVGPGPGPGVPQALVDNASLILDFTRGETTAYTTVSGDTESGDTDFVRSVAVEKSPAGAQARWTRDADEHVYGDSEATRIRGQGVLRTVNSASPLLGSGANNTTANFIDRDKWWFCWHGRGAGTSADIASYQWGFAATAFRLFMTYQPSTGTTRISVHNGSTITHYNFAGTNGEEIRIAGYYDGTDLHFWFNDEPRVDHPGTGNLGTLAGNAFNLHRGINNKTIDTSAFWCGKEDGDNAAQHMANIAAWMEAKAA